MMPVKALLSVHNFHESAALMFQDIVDCIKQRGLRRGFKSILGPEGGYFLDAKRSEHFHMYIFEDEKKIRFIYSLIKTHSGLLDQGKGKTKHYLSVCRNLEVDPEFPLLLVYGVFITTNGAGQRFNTDDRVKREWVRNSICLDVPDNSVFQYKPAKFCWNKSLDIGLGSSNSWYLDRASIKLRSLVCLQPDKTGSSSNAKIAVENSDGNDCIQHTSGCGITDEGGSHENGILNSSDINDIVEDLFNM
ncbi:hypothetical protein [Methylococcus capsulatus]|uniref:hypothetical protein n=1 Tax=Methylococcus capsulatus TaxID=414 RepID=UPI001C529A55|nr:hypothetical protein [Methylococcus capsulatus]QXP87717.1 hypothetical protein KW112_00730 [Methylococcus capsulatus]